MQDLQGLKQNYDKNTLKTIVVDLKNYNKLKELGHFGDSYNTIIGSLLEERSK
jgi:predicted CopG family antitoxin